MAVGSSMMMPVGPTLMVVSPMTSGGALGLGRMVVPGLMMMPLVGSTTMGPMGALVIVMGPGLLLGGLFGGLFGGLGVRVGWGGTFPGRVGVFGGLLGGVGGSFGLLGGSWGSLGGS